MNHLSEYVIKFKMWNTKDDHFINEPPAVKGKLHVWADSYNDASNTFDDMVDTESFEVVTTEIRKA